MAAPQVRAPSLYHGSKKIAECNGGDLDIKMEGERVYGDQGPYAITDGALTADLTFKAIVPSGGMEVDEVKALIARQYLTMGLPYGDSFIKVPGKLTAAKLTWDKQKGTFTGDFTFTGLEPQVV